MKETTQFEKDMLIKIKHLARQIYIDGDAFEAIDYAVETTANEIKLLPAIKS